MKIDYTDLINALKISIKEISSKNYAIFKILSAYIYGQNAHIIIEKENLLSDEIDLLVLVDSELKPGEAPINTESKSIIDCYSFRGRKFRTIFNGIIPANFDSNNELLIDIIGDGKNNIEKKDPASIIVCQKPKLLIFGQDYYTPLINESLSAKDKIHIFNTIIKYINREFLPRNDVYAQKIIAKNVIFLASLSFDESLRLNNKSQIINFLKQKIIQESEILKILNYFLNVYQSTTLHDWLKLKSNFKIFCEKFHSILLNDLS